MAKLPNLPMRRRFAAGGTATEDITAGAGGAGTFPGTTSTDPTTGRIAIRPISGVQPDQKVGITQGEMIDPVATTISTEELVDFGTTNQTQLATAPTVSTTGATAIDVGMPTIQSANTYSAYTQQNTPAAAAATGTISSASLIGDPTEFAKTASLERETDTRSIAAAQTTSVANLGTVKGQLESLYASMESGEDLPAWAAPAVRKVNAIMQQRGLGASSMAAAAITQAIYESAIPIASQDAKTYSAVDLQNLNNKQQATLQNAMTYAAMDRANMGVRVQAATDNAKAFLTIDVKEMDNAQRINEINHQTNTQKMLTEISQENASRQFNSKSQNETDEFFAELGSQIGNSNSNRSASISQVNADQANSMQRFVSQMQDSRDKFNSNMAAQILQSNANWRRETNTRDTASLNEANRMNAQNLLGLTAQSQANLWQRYRDEASWVMQASESNLQRAHQSAMIAQEAEANSSFYDKQFEDSVSTSVGTAAYNLLLGGLFG
tara:strand:- start:2186 stop:3673 length:1488 start_codon:yes stop_codon:yes gene_type:complete